MTELSKRLYLILIISYIINQFNVHGQSTTIVTPTRQSSNLTLLSILSYTSQSPININQRSSSFFTSSKSHSANTMITTVPLNHTRRPPPIATHIPRPSSAMISRTPSVMTTNLTRPTSMTTARPAYHSNNTSSNFARKYEQYITLLILFHFLLFIFPIH